ncbi:MAG: hypothetical protein AAF570_02930, partial [Bacteroidota bacterium]
MRAILGAGLGATLEVPIIENQNSLLGVSLRGRWLWTTTWGRDYERSTDIATNGGINGSIDPTINYSGQSFYYANHRTRAHNLDLELMLKANRLRARTGVLAYVWGGVGLMNYRSFIDQNDLTGLYDYTTITSTTKEAILSDLWFLRNGEYDSPGDRLRPSHWVFAPSAGIGLGYEFNPWFSIAFEYKVTFPFTDYLDGRNFDSGGIFGDNDIHHYGGLGIALGIVGGGSGGTVSRPPPRPTGGDKPRCVVINPPSGTDVVMDCRYNIRVRLYNVRNKQLINFYMNNRQVSPDRFAYEPSTGMFSATVDLQRGRQNNFRIIAKNRYGSDTRSFSLTCKSNAGQFDINPPPPPPPPPPAGGLPPEVYITYPQGCPAIVPECRTRLYAEIYRIRDKRDITVYHYGQVVPQQYYSYDPFNQQFAMDINLDPGDNRIEIVARNNFGQDRANTVLRCPVQAGVVLPVVNITNPNVSPFSSPNCTQQVSATVTGVRSRNDIVVYVDGNKTNDFTWSPGNGLLR